ncbi:uncharacterized protein LOC128642111 isoform X2 [Bombina bombina]|uniref:uncharacterized protein LOC128642111 isoform X2 n=1 Tax=Bombina bombina TaxID=8345 RepID=UPI00235A7D8B|nr:uncharacterized protein LOC128642111 isoform X2 [Bombina bombina]
MERVTGLRKQLLNRMVQIAVWCIAESYLFLTVVIPMYVQHLIILNPFQRIWDFFTSLSFIWTLQSFWNYFSTIVSGKHTVGIFSRDDQSNYKWLLDILQSRYFSNNVNKVRPVYIFNNRRHKFEEEVSNCTFAVLYHTKNQGRVNIIGVPDSLYDHELKYLSATLGAANVFVVIDDLEESGPEEKNRILNAQTKISDMAHDLFLFNEEEKLLLLNQSPHESCLPEKLQRMRDIMSTGNGRFKLLFPILVHPRLNENRGVNIDKTITHHRIHEIRGLNVNRTVTHTVGIFSRDSQSSYTWLIQILQSQYLSNHVKEVRPVYISNNGQLKFKEEVTKCTFAILYHTKNRGRINIAGVTDSLYDDELEHLSDRLEKSNVIVVIDDLDESGPEEKYRIIQQQPKLGDMAEDLFLFNKVEKQSLLRMQGNQPPPGRNLQDKLQRMREIISRGA